MSNGKQTVSKRYTCSHVWVAYAQWVQPLDVYEMSNGGQKASTASQ